MPTSRIPVWSWDITKLRGPAKWTYYYLYVILDIFSRYVVGWMVAAPRIRGAGRGADPPDLRQAGHRPRPADHPRRPRLVDDLQAGGVPARRPRRHPVALAPARLQRQPVQRGAVQDAEVPARLPRPVHLDRGRPRALPTFFPWYNDEHRHTGLALHTPADVHYGTAAITREKRAGVLDAAYAAHPERFVRKPPEPPELRPETWMRCTVCPVPGDRLATGPDPAGRCCSPSRAGNRARLASIPPVARACTKPAASDSRPQMNWWASTIATVLGIDGHLV